MKPGLFRHFKGGIYLVHGVVTHTETSETFVHYQEYPNGELWIKPLDLWYKEVILEDGSRPVRYRRISKEELQEKLKKK